MFRVRVRVDPVFLKEHSADPRAGQPGVAYVRLDPATPWPAFLEPGATDAAQR
jgi:HlyD family secretion protein